MYLDELNVCRIVYRHVLTVRTSYTRYLLPRKMKMKGPGFVNLNGATPATQGLFRLSNALYYFHDATTFWMIT
jgi:hypothetical protein